MTMADVEKTLGDLTVVKSHLDQTKLILEAMVEDKPPPEESSEMVAATLRTLDLVGVNVQWQIDCLAQYEGKIKRVFENGHWTIVQVS